MISLSVSVIDIEGPTLLYQNHIASEIFTGVISLFNSTLNPRTQNVITFHQRRNSHCAFSLALIFPISQNPKTSAISHSHSHSHTEKREMLRSILRAATATSSKPKSKPKPHSWTLQSSPIPTVPPPQYSFSTARNYSVKNAKSTTATKGKKGKFNKSGEDAAPAEVDMAVSEAQARARRLAMDEKDPTLNVGPNGLPLFTSTPSLSLLSHKDTCSYFKFSMESLKSALPEGLPTGMVKEFEDSLRPALLVRQSFLDLRDNFRRIVDPPLTLSHSKGPKVRKQVVLDGPVSCGKSIALAMLVHWARDEGWLVFYVPRGRDWTHGGFFYRNPNTGLWDTPLQAENVLKYNSWFTLSEYEEAVKVHSRQPVHARELTMVNAFRSMMHDDMMVGAFSHSTAIGKLRKDLPDVPEDARVNCPRYTLDEAASVCHYYLRQRLVQHEVFSEENWKKVYYLANGNGSEMRGLVPFMRQST
ncbi:hypothetical protein RGQ29_018752 [Quercus rubra]|uniref:Small ribosomal subunit protein mS29 n=1 Tax=Quercus rubra TaxID=3512 RepID=A0AAN7FPG9_QUERU|nr:hypothetical protein RGQ29_018752 [Quercus rubra]